MRRSVLLVIAAATIAAGCGGSEDDSGPSDAGRTRTSPKIEDPGPIHVHGLGINPKDRALFIATHTGLFRAPEGEQTAKRIADRYQDTMGFTVIGPDRFLGSGHPDAREGLPPFLGLIRSSDAGQSWDTVSLTGKNDFHVLEAAGKRVYGFGTNYDSRRSEFLVSGNEGRSWTKRSPPGPLISLAISPEDPDRVVAAAEDGAYRSDDAGRSWRLLTNDIGLLAWTRSGSIVLLDAAGTVSTSGDGGRSWQGAGSIGGKPAAFEAAGNDLFAALHDGAVKQSKDGGKSWTVRSTPRLTVTE